MSGGKITDQQIRIYMNERKSGKTQTQAAAKANLSERSGRRIDKSIITTSPKNERHWRTREDPLEAHWQAIVCPLLEANPALTPITIHEHLCDNYPDQYETNSLRTLQRRIKQWRLVHGPEKEVIFRQEKIVGEMGISDFTLLKDIVISIRGELFDHRLYHYRLVYSGWRFVKVIHGGESFAALSAGLQDAFWRCGGVPKEHRTDSLSAAYNNHSEKTQFTAQYESLSRHYGFKPTRNNSGVSHENGAIESPHAHLKQRMRQALLLRGSHDFESLDDYQSFLNRIVAKLNGQHKTRINEERKHLKPLPKYRTHDYSELAVAVTSSGTITVKRVLYTVPSRLIGSHLRVHVYDDKLALYAGHELVAELPRLYAKGTLRRRRVDYRHVIDSLAKKPQAFRYSLLRDDLLPGADYQTIWQHVDHHLESKKACKYIVSVLFLAASEDCESELGRFICQGIAKQQLPSLDRCREHFSHVPCQYPVTHTQQHSLNGYDDFISCQALEVNHG
jgi:hypothetical protein